MAFDSEAGLRMLQQQEELAAVNARIDLLQREVSKLEPRLLLCSEQVRVLRREGDEQRAMLAVSASDAAAAITALQEEADTLQSFTVSLEGAVSRQVEARFDQPLLSCLHLRTHADTRLCTGAGAAHPRVERAHESAGGQQRSAGRRSVCSSEGEDPFRLPVRRIAGRGIERSIGRARSSSRGEHQPRRLRYHRLALLTGTPSLIHMRSCRRV